MATRLTPAVPPLAAPVVAGWPEADPDENDDPVGKDDVGTLSGSEAIPLPLVDAV